MSDPTILGNKKPRKGILSLHPLAEGFLVFFSSSDKAVQCYGSRNGDAISTSCGRSSNYQSKTPKSSPGTSENIERESVRLSLGNRGLAVLNMPFEEVHFVVVHVNEKVSLLLRQIEFI